MGRSKEEKKSALLAVAREMFDRYGPHKVTLDDIARAAGMAVPSLYYYFPSKSELLREVVVAEHREMLGAIERRVAAAAGPEQKLLELSRLVFEKMRKLSRLPGMSRGERMSMFAEIEQEAQRFKQAIVEIIEGILVEGLCQGVFEVERPDLAARMFAAGLRGLFETVLDGEFPEDDLEGLERMCGFLVRGIKRR